MRIKPETIRKRGSVPKNGSVFFTIFQSVMTDGGSEDEPSFNYQDYPPDFFDVNKFAAEGDFPGSLRIPGTKTSFQIGGYVQADAIFDADRIGNKDSFVVSTIPTGGDKTGAGDTNACLKVAKVIRDELNRALGAACEDELTTKTFKLKAGKPFWGSLTYDKNGSRVCVRVWLIPNEESSAMSYVIYLRAADLPK